MKKTIITLLTALTAVVAAEAISFVHHGYYAGENTTDGGSINSIITSILCPDPSEGPLIEVKVDGDDGTNGGLTVKATGSWSWDGPSFPTVDLLGLALKSGNGFDLYSITGFTPGDTISDADWASLKTVRQGLSHFSLYYKDGEAVPDTGSTLALLGAGLFALAFFRTRKS